MQLPSGEADAAERFLSLPLDMLCIASVDGYFKRVSPAFTATLGWSAEELLSTPMLGFVHPDDRVRTRREIDRQKVSGAKVVRFENRYRHKDGSWRTLAWRAVRQPQGMIYATARDVTREHEIIAQLRQANAELVQRLAERGAELDALQAKEEALHSIVDHLFEAVVTIDQRGIVRSANPALLQMLGYTPAEMVGRNVSCLMPEPFRSAHDGYLHRYLSTGRAHVVGSSREVVGQHKDGRLIPLELSVNVYRDGGERWFIGSLRDVSERKRFVAELREARREAEQANRAKSAFLAAMSHEIRTPMNGVLGMAELLAQTRLTHGQADAVKTIRDSAASLLGLIDDILDFSKIEAGRLELEHIPASVLALVESVAQALVPVAAAKGVELAVFVDPRVPDTVLTDPTRLRQVLYNLVGNAIKFSGGRQDLRGDVRIRVEPAGAPDDPTLTLVFTVSDNGIGMTAETQSTLFMPFMQAEASTTRRFGGTGLGLVISKRLVEMMHGDIAVDSAPGCGAMWTVRLPFEVVPGPAPAPPYDLSGVDCILVECPALAVDDLRSYLEFAGARTHKAVDARSAAALAAGLAAPVLIRDTGGDKDMHDASMAAFAAAPHARHLLITRGRRRRARVESDDTVTLDGNGMSRQSLLRAVAVAAGRASPRTFSDSAWASLPVDEPVLPTVDEARSQGRLVLVAEDDPVNQLVVSRQLALLGYASTVSPSGAEALAAWRSGDYALLLTDLHMPDMDGYALTQAIRREEKARAVSRRMPILALTADALSTEVRRAGEAGMDGYLVKPVPLERLRSTLQEWLPSAVPTRG